MSGSKVEPITSVVPRFILALAILLLLAQSVVGYAQTVSFGPAANFPAGSTPLYMALGDFNADGIQDLAVNNFNGNNVSILLGTGTGSFAAPTNFSVGNGPRSIAVGDFNGDGKRDADSQADRIKGRVAIPTGYYKIIVQIGRASCRERV